MKARWISGVGAAGWALLAQAADWPMWRYDAARSAASPGALPTNLTLLWSRQLPPARQAWPLEPNRRLNFDASYKPVVMGKSMLLGSPNDGSVTAYDTASGEERWKVFTEGQLLNERPLMCMAGCNYMTGSRHLVLVRDQTASYGDIDRGRQYHLRNMRSGCSNSLIPADGLVNVPNFAMDCVCNYAIETSFALTPMPEVEAWMGTTPFPVVPPPPRAK